jgi:hypothetical protein
VFRVVVGLPCFSLFSPHILLLVSTYHLSMSDRVRRELEEKRSKLAELRRAREERRVLLAQSERVQAEVDYLLLANSPG